MGCYVNACRDHLVQNNRRLDQNHHHDQSNCGRNYGSRLQPAGCKRPSTSSGLEHSSQLCNRSSDQVMLPFKSVTPFGSKFIWAAPQPPALQFGQLFHFSKSSKSIWAGGSPQFGHIPFLLAIAQKKGYFFLGSLP